MPSSGNRKKNKGRERKAKKEESKKVQLYNFWRNWVNGKDDNGRDIIQCDHGLVERLPDVSHPVSSFIHSYFCSGLIPNHQDVLNNDNNRELAAVVLTSIGANLLCMYPATAQTKPESQQLIIRIALTIMMLENYDRALDYESNLVHPSVTEKNVILQQSGSVNVYRDFLKFFRKRMNCKCLKKMHLEARKTLPKLGVCWHCKHVRERILLSVCSRCMVNPYCSRECQVAASPYHRSECDKYVRAGQGRSGLVINRK